MSMGMGRRRLPQHALARRWLLATTAIGLAGCLALSQPVYADNECGPIAANSVTCTSAGNDYTSGISYNTSVALTMIVQDGVIVDATGDDVEGIFVQRTSGGSLNLTIGAATISTGGDNAEGVYAKSTGGAYVTFGGSVITSGDNSHGILASGETVFVTVMSSGEIVTSGDNAHGIYMLGETASAYVAGLVETHGANAAGVLIQLGNYSADITTTSGSAIRTDGYRSYGIHVVGPYLVGPAPSFVDITVSGAIETGRDYLNSTSNSYAHSIFIEDNFADVAVTLSDTGSIKTHGGSAHGIYIGGTGNSSYNYDVTIDVAGALTANGPDSDGVRVTDTYGAVDITISGSVSGGGSNGAGIYLNNPYATSSSITIESSGEIGALSDIAIKSVEPVIINNSGIITGIVTLGSGNDVFTNNYIWYLRNHADTDGDGVRDIEGVASADFGGGTDDQFTNNGTLSLLKHSSSLWQGAILGLESFSNSGSIDLQDGIVGDTLSISGNFISNGGSLWLDAVLDDGSSSPQADVLSLESVILGSAATQIHVANAGGLGAATSGNGILLVDADADDSGGSAFTMADPVIAGAYRYDLAYDAAGFDWYLQSAGYFSGTQEYPALMTAALMGFGSDLAALQERVGDLRWEEEEGERIEPAGWTARPALGIRPWVQLTGAEQAISAETNFDQQVVKLEGGFDSSFITGNGARAVLGGFAGTGRAEQDFDNSSTVMDSDMALAGLYGGYRSGGFYGNAILKYEHHWAELTSVATDADGSNYDVDLFGGSLESGYHFEAGRGYLQPRLRVSYTHGWASDFADSSGEVIDLKDAESLLGDAAARLGFRPGDEARVSDVYAEAGVRHEFLGETEAVVSGLVYTDALPGTTAFVSGGLAVRLLQDKLSLLFEAGYAKGDAAEELTATGALRVMY